MAVTREPTVDLDAEFAAHFPQSLALAQRAARVFPGAVTHDSRHFEPFAVAVDHAQGARKWTVDGHELIDYWVGHGALLLGHNDAAVAAAVQAQLARGTHFGASHALELEWGELVLR